MVWEAGADLEIHVCVGGVSCGMGSRGVGHQDLPLAHMKDET